MDSITQITLGAAIGEAILGHKVGRKAAFWGGVCGTLPDLDSFIQYGEAVASVTYHRSFSHSIFVLILLTPLLSWLICKVHPGTGEYRKGWLLLVFLALITHPVLDCFTVYGTQILWPFYIYPVSWSTLFIIDPAYTTPLLLGVLIAIIFRRYSNRAYLFNYAGLIISSLYLCWSVAAKIYIDVIAVASLTRQGIPYQQVMSTPAPLNTFLWRVVARDVNVYYDGYYSIFDQSKDIEFINYTSDDALLSGIEEHWPVKRLQWFTHGFYSVTQKADEIVMTDLRMGMEPNYIFNYKVAEIGDPHPTPVASVLLPGNWQPDQFIWVWDRLKRSLND